MFSELFYRAAMGAGQGARATGRGLMATWNAVAGNTRMIKNGMKPNYALQKGMAFGGGIIGMAVGEVIALSGGGLLMWPALIAAGALGAPVVAHQAYTTFKCGEVSVKRIENERAKQKLLAPPKPDGLI